MIIQYKNLIKKDIKDYYYTSTDFKITFNNHFYGGGKYCKIDLINFIKVDENLKTLKFITTWLINDSDKVYYYSVYYKYNDFIKNYVCEEKYKKFKNKLNLCEYFKKSATINNR